MNPALAFTWACGVGQGAGTYGNDLFELVRAIQLLIEAIETGDVPDDADENEAEFIDMTLGNFTDENGSITEPVWLGIRSQSDDFDIPIWEGCYVRQPTR